MPTMLIAGASGVVGGATLDLMLESADWDVVALSRREPETRADRPFRHVSVDLRDAAATAAVADALADVSHIVYAALFEKPGLTAGWTERDQMETNSAMLRNLLGTVLDAGAPLQHVSLMQGTKAYGAHLHPIPIPARERSPRDPHENFYWLQEDLLRVLAERRGFSFTILRPQLILGGAVGVAMNIVPVLGAYAAICREEDRPFAFPGGAPYVWEAVDARLCALALRWAAEAPAARGETFNLTNGDVFEWHALWPAIADAVGLQPAPPSPMAIAPFLDARASTWDRIVERHGLRPLILAELVGESHHYADLCFNLGGGEYGFPRFVSTIKIRQAGFGACFDTEDTLRHWLGVLADRRLVPSPSAAAVR